MAESLCKHCQQPVIWIYTVPRGSRMPLEPEAIPVPNARLVAFNHSTGRGMVLKEEHVTPDRDGVMPAELWAENARVTFHRSHFVSKRCKEAQKAAEAAKATAGG